MPMQKRKEEHFRKWHINLTTITSLWYREMAAAEAVSVFTKVAGVATVAAAKIFPSSTDGPVEVEAR